MSARRVIGVLLTQTWRDRSRRPTKRPFIHRVKKHVDTMLSRATRPHR